MEAGKRSAVYKLLLVVGFLYSIWLAYTAIIDWPEKGHRLAAAGILAAIVAWGALRRDRR